ncbi:di-trans,poly-cis-decaprenylcistransferase [Candidatus Woesearchaeota archaeon]|nr:di-trans,poly-cis-decaprenylcistransferase [Candidatus Woesearchaeota archaeon]
MAEKPRHIGIILDGNRRFAKRLMKEPWKGHEYGAKKIGKLLDWCQEVGIKEMTLYAFSMQNFNRPKIEFNYLMKIFKEFFDNEEYNNKIHSNKIKIKFIGRIHLFPKDVYEKMKELEEATKDYDDYTINFAMAYGGREEIIDGIKKLGRNIEDGKINASELNEEVFEKFLYMNSEPDLIIRTGGDHRTSNFLAWQGVYAEWFFLEKMWPEFEKEDLMKCIEDFSNRERRFGK